jgi:4-hydroxy-tetrahydrodipicolinate synthase
MFKGLYTALVTPFNKDGSLDIKAFQDLVEWQIQEGVAGIVVMGTTGESPTITFEERDVLVKTCINTVNKRAQVIVGTGSNSTETTIKYTKHAKELGASGALVITPYYNKPTQEGIYQHYKAINDNVDLPILLYNAPSRSVVNISDQTISRLADLENIVGIKDCTGASRPLFIYDALKNKNFLMFTGDDPDAVGFNANGGIGCISVVSNIMPKLCVQIQKLMQANNFKEALHEHRKLTELTLAMFCETNPIPVKYALSKMGKCFETMRLPLVPLQENSKIIVDKALTALQLI